VLDCVVGFGQAYLDCKKVLAGGGGNTRQMSLARFRVSRTEATAVAATGAVPELAEMLEWSARLNDQLDAFAYIFGDRIWLTSTEGVRLKTWLDAFFAATLETSDGTVRVTDSEKAALLAVPLPSDITLAMATKLIERNNRTADYYDRGILKLTDVPAGASIDFYALDVAQEKFGRSIQAQTLSEAQGFESPLAGLVKSVETLRDQGAKQTQGVCARVKIQIDQEAVLTRQAFMGTMEVTNNSETNAMQDVRVVLDIRDSDGNSVNGRFFIKGPEVTGMAGAAGNGVLAPGATGRLQYTFIPTREAAPLEPTVYSFAGTLQFSDGAQQVALPLLPANIVVRPDARLSLKYFLQRDVYSDDPFTDGVEPAEPF
jgi:hypothetical protein